MLLLLLPLLAAQELLGQAWREGDMSGQSGGLESVVCSVTPEGYVVPDPGQCDRYASCSPSGDLSVLLCPDGLVLDPAQGKCDYPAKDSQGKGLCTRRNGNFPLSAEVSCSDYVDCREGRQYLQSCGAGAVFDEVLGCVHPDETQRPGCTAEERYSVQCPAITAGLRPRFGDHDRIPHPTDCRLFFACLRNGHPRLLSCERPSVFSPASGLCEEQGRVAGCELTYREEGREEEERVEQAVRKRLEELGVLGN